MAKKKIAPVAPPEPAATVESKGMILRWRDAVGKLASPTGAYEDYRRARENWPVALETWLGAYAISAGYECDDRQANILAHELRVDYWLREAGAAGSYIQRHERNWAIEKAYSFYLSEQQWLEDRAV